MSRSECLFFACCIKRADFLSCGPRSESARDRLGSLTASRRSDLTRDNALKDPTRATTQVDIRISQSEYCAFQLRGLKASAPTPYLPASFASLAYLAPLIGFVVCFALLKWMLGRRLRLPMDSPNQRSLHQTPVPRAGGIAIMAGILPSSVLLPGARAATGLALILALISLEDDRRGLPTSLRLAAQIGVAVAFGLLFIPQLPLTYMAAAVFAIVWLCNLYNFMDGSDGLAGGMTLIGFGIYGIAAWLAGDRMLALMNFSVAAAAFAFLLFNFHPARIFMGDSGSVPLGFLAAASGLIGWQRGLWPLWLPLLVFSPFIVDATATLIKRALKREKIWRAHRDHYYQRVVRMGFGHSKTAVLEYALMLAAGISALLARNAETPLTLFAFWILAYLSVMIIVDLRWSRTGAAERAEAG